MTMARNENLFLPIWLEYYSKYFDKIVVINDRTTDGSIEECKKKYDFEEIKIKPPVKEEYLKFRLKRVEKIREQFLTDHNNYKYVVFADTDEFIVADPDRYLGLDQYLHQATDQYVYCTGREIVPEEANIVWEEPILKQRSKWWKHIACYKPAISRVNMEYGNGFHYDERDRAMAAKKNIDLGQHIMDLADPDVYLIHLKAIEKGLEKKRPNSHLPMNPQDPTEIPEKWKVI